RAASSTLSTAMRMSRPSSRPVLSTRAWPSSGVARQVTQAAQGAERSKAADGAVRKRAGARAARRVFRGSAVRGDEVADLLLQHGQRHGTIGEDGVVERAHVELRAELGFGLRAQLPDLQLAHLVGEGLARPGDVAVGL